MSRKCGPVTFLTDYYPRMRLIAYGRTTFGLYWLGIMRRWFVIWEWKHS